MSPLKLSATLDDSLLTEQNLLNNMLLNSAYSWNKVSAGSGKSNLTDQLKSGKGMKRTASSAISMFNDVSLLASSSYDEAGSKIPDTFNMYNGFSGSKDSKCRQQYSNRFKISDLCKQRMDKNRIRKELAPPPPPLPVVEPPTLPLFSSRSNSSSGSEPNLVPTGSTGHLLYQLNPLHEINLRLLVLTIQWIKHMPLFVKLFPCDQVSPGSGSKLFNLEKQN